MANTTEIAKFARTKKPEGKKKQDMDKMITIEQLKTMRESEDHVEFRVLSSSNRVQTASPLLMRAVFPLV